MLTRQRVLLMAYLIAAAPLCARGADILPGMAKLFDLGMKNTPPAVKAARQTAVRLKRANMKDMRVDYAFGVVLANQRRYDDAIRLLERYLKTQPRDFAAHQVKIWAEMQNKRYADVLKSAAAISKQLPVVPGAALHDDDVEAAQFLGMIFGYLELVRPGDVSDKTLSAHKNAVLARLGETYLSAFDEGRAVVAAKLAELEADRDARLQRAEQAASQRKEQNEAALNDNLEKVSNQREAIQTSTEQLRDAQREFSVIQRQLASLADDRRRITAQMVILQAQLAQVLPPATNTNLGQPITSNRNSTAIARGVIRAEDLTNDPNATLSIEQFARATALSLALAGLNKQAFDVDRRIFELRTRGGELAGHGRQQAQTLRQSQEIAAKAAKRADRIEKQLARDEAAVARSSAAPSGRILRFSTYFPLPYEREKERVLGWFAP